jgi:hypothetical protein
MADLTPGVCGTYGGYQRHKRRGETPCGGCRQANREYGRRYRAERPEVRQQELADNRARSRALWRLAEECPDRFRQLVVEELIKESAELART